MTRAPSSRRYLSIWLRRLTTDRLERSGTRADGPLVVVEDIKGALRLCAMNDAAAQLGLTAGMALADARAMYPRLTAIDADPQADRRLLEAIADWCDRYTPLVGLDAPDGLLLDIAGCAHLFGGEAALCRDLVRRLAAQDFHARVAVADTVGCAWAVTRYGGKEICIVPPEHTREVLLRLPLAALRIAPDTVAALAQVGLKRIADVADRPRAPLAARFGEEFVRRIDQAFGREDEPITPRLPVPAAVAEQRFADPIAREADVLGTIEDLARRLKDILERRGEGARVLQVALFRADGKVHRLELGTAAPLREAPRIRALFAERLTVLGDACDPGFGFDMVRLAVLVSERCEATQTGLAAPDQTAELAHLVDRLGARFGLRRVTRMVAQDTHIPEFAVAAMPAHAVSSLPSLWGGSAAKRPGWGASVMREHRPKHHPPPHPSPFQGEGARERALIQDSLAPIRPIRLLERPEPIEATAEVPDGPPVQFTWRRVHHVVAHAEGPGRIAMEWWRDDEGRALTRDYFRVESHAGVRVWLYREGFFDDRKPPSWFLHGVFA